MVPLILISLMYAAMTVSIFRNKIPVGRLLVTTTAILLSGVFVVIPQVLMVTMDLKMSFKVGKILTITVFHMNCIFNPIIYCLANPRISPQIKQQASAKSQYMKNAVAKTLSKTTSGFFLVPLNDPTTASSTSSERKRGGSRTFAI